MKYYGNAQDAADAILHAFSNPESLPKALAPMFLAVPDALPCAAWSWLNRTIVALFGHTDARGFRQWQSVGRSVKKGEKAIPILIPIIKSVEVTKTKLSSGKTAPKTDDAGIKIEERRIVVGYKSAPVFGYRQTEGRALPHDNLEERAERVEWLRSLPLREVAEAWGLEIDVFPGNQHGPLGWHRSGNAIALGVKNLSTWCHELIHAADDRNGKLNQRPGQQLDNETVAELGGSILSVLLGRECEADLGGCWEYLSYYAERENKQVISVCNQFLTRSCQAVDLLLTTAAELEGKTAKEADCA